MSLDLPNCHAGGNELFRYRSGHWEQREHGWLAVPGAHYCSWCGSVDPLTFIKLCEPGNAMRVEVADWKYGFPHKVYLDVPSADPDALTYVGGVSEATVGAYAPGGERYTPPPPDAVAETDLTEEQRAILVRDGAPPENPPRPNVYYRFGTRDIVHQKFYTVHLDDLPEITDEQKALMFARTGIEFFRGDDSRTRWRGGKPGF